MKTRLYIAATHEETATVEEGARLAARRIANLCRGGSAGLCINVCDALPKIAMKKLLDLVTGPHVRIGGGTDKQREEAALLWRCEMIARLAHHGQTRRMGGPYVDHPLAVADAVKSNAAKCVALLHDTMEDNPLINPALLLKFGVSEEVVQAVQVITKHPGELYNVYLNRVAENRLSCEVKIADIQHNLSCAPKPEKVATYKEALKFLKSKLKWYKQKKSKRPSSKRKT